MTIAVPAIDKAYHRLGWPTLFILMWSSGYVAGKVALPFSGPFTLIFMRFSSSAFILLLFAFVMRVAWPKSPAIYMHLCVVGILVQALQFSGLYVGLSLGVSAGISALIVGMMPILTAIGAVALLGEHVAKKQVVGLFVGLFGVAVVVLDKIGLGHAQWAGYLAILLALCGISAGAIYQKKFIPYVDLRAAGCVQLAVASLVVAPLAFVYERFEMSFNLTMLVATGWLSLVNSIGAVSVLFLMMRRGEASKVASLFYLIPSTTAVMGYLVLGEKLNGLQISGFMISAAGVYLSTQSSGK